MPDAPSQYRGQVLEAFARGIEAARGDTLVQRALQVSPPQPPVALVAAGKAAAAMARGAAAAMGRGITRGLVIGPESEFDDSGWPFPCRFRAGDHPVPGPRSLQAGDALLSFLDEDSAGEGLIFCISGGASSLAEAPPDGVSPADIRRAYRWLLHSGLDIATVNAVRQRLSRIKGGRLVHWLADRRALVLAVSDVPGNDPAIIGSGWLAPPLAPPRDGLPDWLRALMERSPAAPETASPMWRRIENRILGDVGTALEPAEAALRQHGRPVVGHETRLAGDVRQVASRIAEGLAHGPGGFELWGGECTVRLHENAGRGGRCQHLALSVALALAGRDGWCLLAAGTDGRDGNSDAAGAIVDGGTVARGEEAGLDAREALAAFDSGGFLEASGDLVDTGATGTNVNDLVVGARW